MFTKALIPLDGTEVAEGILPFATQMARDMHMKVVLARAVDFDHLQDGVDDSGIGRLLKSLVEDERPLPLGSTVEAEPRESRLVARIEREISAPLEELAERMRLEGIAAETALGYGPVSDAIIRMALETNCDLIAMSTRGRSLLVSGLLGSVTYKVIHESPLPVLAITPERARLHTGNDRGIDRIIVPMDGSDFAEAVLPHAAALASGLDTGVTLLRVVPEGSDTFGGGMVSLDLLARIDDLAAARAVDYLAVVKQRLGGSGIDVETDLLRGKVSSVIAARAHEAENCMIALTTHGRSGARRMLLGSVAEAVIRESGVPVLVVRPDGGAN